MFAESIYKKAFLYHNTKDVLNKMTRDVFV